MGLLDMFPEAATAVNIGSRVLGVLEGMLNNTDIREKWKETGNVKVKFTVNERYSVHIVVDDIQKRTMLAEVTESVGGMLAEVKDDAGGN